MASTISDIGDEMVGSANGIAQKSIDRLDDDTDEVDIGPFVDPANIVGFAHASLVKHHVDGACMIDDVEPIANVFALTIYRKGFALADIIDEKGYQFFGKLVGTVVVAAVGNIDGQTIGIVKRAHEMVAGRLAGGIGRVRIVAGGFGEKGVVEIEVAIDLIGGYMKK